MGVEFSDLALQFKQRLHFLSHSGEDRLDRVEHELDRADDCDAVIVNDDLDVAVEETLTRIRQFLRS